VKYGPDTKPAPWAASEVKAVDPTTVEVTLRNDLKYDYDVEKAKEILKKAGYQWDAKGRLAFPAR